MPPKKGRAASKGLLRIRMGPKLFEQCNGPKHMQDHKENAGQDVDHM